MQEEEEEELELGQLALVVNVIECVTKLMLYHRLCCHVGHLHTQRVK